MQNTQFLSEIDIDTWFISTEDHGLPLIQIYEKIPDFILIGVSDSPNSPKLQQL